MNGIEYIIYSEATYCTRINYKSTEDYVTYVSDKVDAYDKTTSILWYSTPILVHFLEENNKTLDKYLEQFTDVERKRYKAKALEALKSFIFIRGCKCTKQNIMPVELEKLCAHGLNDVFPMKLNDAVRLYKQQYMLKPNKGNCTNNNNNDNEAGKKNKDDDEEKQEEAKGGEQLAITANFPSEGTEDQTEVDHSKDPDRAATMLHKIQEQAKLGLESDSKDDFTSDEETKVICAMFGVDHIDVDLDNLDSIDDDDEDSIGGESPLMGYSLLITDDNIDSIDNNDEDSIGGESPLALQPRDDDLSVNNAVSDFLCKVNIPCTRKYKPVINSSIEISDVAQPTPRSFSKYNFTSDFTSDNYKLTIGFQFTESKTMTILEHFYNRPHLKPEMQTPPTKPYNTGSNIFTPYMSWNIFTPYLSLFLLGWNIFTHYLDLFFLSVLIKLVESSIFSMLSVLYSSIGLLELADRIWDILCPPCYYLLHHCTTTVVAMLPNSSVSFYVPCYRGRQASSGKRQWRLGSRQRRNFWQQDHCNRGS